MKSMSYILFKILIDLTKKNIANVSEYHRKQTVCAYYYIYGRINVLERNGLVKTRMNGRKRMVQLTKKGRKEAELLSRSHLIKLWMRGRI